MSWYLQNDFDVRLEWGIQAVEHLAADVDCAVIVDVMSFSTCVSLATDNGALIYPYPWKDESAIAFGKQAGALIASFNRRLVTEGYSLSPQSLVKIPEGTKLVLPSPNGSAISFRARDAGIDVFSGCFRNITATARACRQYKRILVIPCGERWPDGSLRPSLEDYVAAGGIIASLVGRSLSPEAEAAAAAWKQASDNHLASLYSSSSARELQGRGFGEDVRLCLETDVSEYACRLNVDCYVSA